MIATVEPTANELSWTKVLLGTDLGEQLAAFVSALQMRSSFGVAVILPAIERALIAGCRRQVGDRRLGLCEERRVALPGRDRGLVVVPLPVGRQDHATLMLGVALEGQPAAAGWLLRFSGLVLVGLEPPSAPVVEDARGALADAFPGAVVSGYEGATAITEDGVGPIETGWVAAFPDEASPDGAGPGWPNWALVREPLPGTESRPVVQITQTQSVARMGDGAAFSVRPETDAIARRALGSHLARVDGDPRAVVDRVMAMARALREGTDRRVGIKVAYAGRQWRVTVTCDVDPRHPIARRLAGLPPRWVAELGWHITGSVNPTAAP